jgi:hypothetical protein
VPSHAPVPFGQVDGRTLLVDEDDQLGVAFPLFELEVPKAPPAAAALTAMTGTARVCPLLLTVG